MKADVVVDLLYGDCGKGKVCYSLLSRNPYTHCLRYNGGGNCGHTIYFQGKKIITHYVPSGVLQGVKSIIGPGCVVSPTTFLTEVEYLKQEAKIDVSLLKIAKNAHIITSSNIIEDSKDTRIGTTKQGTGPAYRDKYARIGKRAEDVKELESFLIDIYKDVLVKDAYILCEGAQGFGLDINWGDYPYVTSSHCVTGSVCLNGIPHSLIKKVYGVAKAYTTYVGFKKFQPYENPIFDKIVEFGEEFGATTKRKRQVNWLDYNLMERAININGVTDLIINKMDILDRLNKWGILYNGKVLEFSTKKAFQEWIQNSLQRNTNLSPNKIIWSYSPRRI